MTDLNAAERRLSNVAAIKDCEFIEGLLQVYECTDFSVVHGMYETDLRAVANRRLQELNESPIDEAFARSVGEDVEHGWFLVGHHGGGRAYLIRYQTGWQLRITGRVDIPNPTIGDFFTACRLFKVQLKEGV